MLTKHNMYIFLKIFSILIPSKNLRKKYRDSISYFLFKPTKSEIENVCHMMSNKQTIEYIVSSNCSYCRYGDGEIGYMLNENFQHFFQPQNAILRQKLKYILENPIENCIIGIPIWIKEAKNQLYKKFQVSYWHKFVPFLKGDVNYGCAHTFSQNAFLNEENYSELLKKMWDRKDVVLITGENSAFIWDERLFSNINSKEIITTKAIDAFSEFDNILKNIKEKFKPQDNKLFLLSLGLTATVLAYELAKLGYQALDIGHVSVNYLSSIGEIENIEVLRKTGKFADGKIDIKKVLKKS